jgi:membrane protease YdiL (CAAX protease family)
MSDQGIRFWLSMFYLAAVMIACDAAWRMIAQRRFSVRQAFYLMTAVSALAFSIALRAKYWP